jgi:hypothetical protein
VGTRDVVRLQGAVAVMAATRLLAPAVVIDPALPPIPLPLVIPDQAPPLHIPRFGDRYTWGDVDTFVDKAIGTAWDQISGLWSGVSGAIEDAIANAIHAAISTAQTAWSSFANLAIDYTGTVFTQLTGILDALIAYVLEQVAFLGDSISWLAAAVDYLGTIVVGGILETLRDLERWVGAAIDAVAGGIEAWAIDNIYHPLLNEIERVRRDVTDWLAGSIDAVWNEMQRLIHSETAQRLAAVAALAGIVAGLAEWVRECGDHMCQLIGPKTDLGKILKALDTAAIVAAIAEVSTWDESDLQGALRTLRGISRGVIGDVESFFTGGGTIGDIVTGG